MAYLVAMGHSANLVKSEFDKLPPIPRHDASKKIEKSFENKVIFTSTFNPNVSQVIICCLHLTILDFSITFLQMVSYLKNVKTSKIY